MTGPAVSPNSFTMSVTERLPLGFDATLYLVSGQSVASVSATLTNFDTEAVTVPVNDPIVSNNVVTQIIDGTQDLAVGHRYLLNLVFTASPSTTRWSMQLVLVAVP